MANGALSLVPVDFDPFAADAPTAPGLSLVSVDFDPFANEAPAGPALEPFPEAVTPNDVLPGTPPADPGEIGRLETAGGEFVRGLGGIGSSGLKGVAISTARDALRMLPLFDAIDQGEDVPMVAAPEAFGGFLRQYENADPAGRRALRQKFVEAGDPRTTPLFEAGDKLDAFVARHTSSNPEFAEEFFAGKLPRGFGSMTGFMAVGIASRGAGIPAVIAPALLGSLVNRTDTFEDALRNGASIEDAYKASDFGAIVGLSEAAPIATILSRLDKGTGGTIKRGLTSLLLGGTEELVQEVGQTIFNNLIASDLVSYDPERDMFVGTDEAAGVGFTTGAVMGFLTSLVGGRRGRQIPPSEREKSTAAPPAVTPGDEASPIPTDIIAEGRAAVQDAEAAGTANDILRRNGLPEVGARVTVTLPDGELAAGEVTDSFTETNAELGLEEDGIKIALDGGGVFEEFVGDLAERGIVIAPAPAEVEPEAAAAPIPEPSAPIPAPIPEPGLEPVDFDPFAETTATEGLATEAAGIPVELPEPSATPTPAQESLDRIVERNRPEEAAEPAVDDEADPAAELAAITDALSAEPAWFSDLTRAGREELALKAGTSKGTATRISRMDWENIPDAMRIKLDAANRRSATAQPAPVPAQTQEPVSGAPTAPEAETATTAAPGEVPAGAILVSTGQLLRSASGRELAPVPRIDASTPGETRNTIKRLDAFLVDEAKKEAAANPTKINEDLIGGLNPEKLSGGDRALLNQALFDNPDGPSAANDISLETTDGITRTQPSPAEEAAPGAPSVAGPAVGIADPGIPDSREPPLAPEAPGAAEREVTPAREQFGVAIAAAQEFVRRKDGGKVTILALQKRFGLDPAVARRVHSKLRSDGDLTAKGFAKAFRKTPRDVLAIIKEMGGVQLDSNLEAMDLRTSRPGLVVGKDKGGRSISDIRERLEEEGLLPERSFDDAVYDLIGAALRKEPGRVIARGEEEVVVAQEGRRVEDDNADALEDARNDVRAVAKEIGELYSTDKVRILATEALESGRDVEDVVSDDAERTALTSLEIFSEEAQDDSYGDIPFAGPEARQVEADRAIEPRQPRPEVEPAVAGPGAPVAEGAPEDRGPPEPAPAQVALKAKSLRKAADKLKERAEEETGRDRLENTPKRARQAAGAQAKAAGDKQIAETALRIADKIDASESGRLQRVSSIADVRALESELQAAMRNRYRKENLSFVEQEKRKGRPPDEEDFQAAEAPTVSIHAGSLKGILAVTKGKRGLAAARRQVEGIQRRIGQFGNISAEEDVETVRALAKAAKGTTEKYSAQRILESIKDLDRMRRLGATSKLFMADILRDYADARSARSKADPVKEAERKLIGAKIPGFFQTPVALAERMVEEADLSAGQAVLEPSAGAGRIADAITNAVGRDGLTLVERQSTLRDILDLKGYDLADTDFLEHQGQYDRIVMNPPFENFQDIDHVRHAYDLLKPGGRLVAIMSPGPFQNINKKATAFREWFEDLGGTEEALPEGTFKESGTGANARLVVIEKAGTALAPEATVQPGEFERNAESSIERAQAAANPAFKQVEDINKAVAAEAGGDTAAYERLLAARADELRPLIASALKERRAGLGRTSATGRAFIEGIADALSRGETAPTTTTATEPTPDLTPPAESPKGTPDIGRLVEEHEYVDKIGRKFSFQVRVNPNGSFSVGTMRTGAWTSQNRFDDFLEARAKAKEFAASRNEEVTTEQTEQGEQIVVPGAERTTGKEFVEAQADKRIKGTKAQKPADEGLFDVAGRGQDELFSFGPVNPRFASDLKRISANLQARLATFGIADRVGLRVVEDLEAVVGGLQVPVEGRFTPGLIEVALRAQDNESDTQWVLDHEVIHALRELELIRDAEWTALSKAAKADTERMGRMRDQRRGQGLTEEQIVEEVIADMFADWSVGRTQAGGFLKRAFERIRDFLTAFGRALTQRGYTSVNDIFEAVESGEVGRRKVPRAELESMLRDPGAAREAYTLGRTLPALEHEPTIKRIIGTTRKPVSQRLRERVASLGGRDGLALKQGLLDEFAVVEEMERADNAGQLKDASFSPFKAAHATKNLNSVMAVILREGPLKIQDGWFTLDREFGKGFEAIFEPLAKSGKLRLWKGWAIAVRADRLKREGRERLLTDAEIAELLPLGAQNPEFQQVMDEWIGFNKKMLDMAETAGLINAEQRAIWEKGDYVPFYRILEDAETVLAAKKGRAGLEGQRSGIRALKGGTSQLNDPLENMVMNMTSLVDRSFKNLAMRKIINLARRTGAVESVGREFKPALITVDEAVKKLEDRGVEIEKLSSKERREVIKMFQLAAPQAPDIVSVMVGGKPVYYRVLDPLLLRSITSMSPPQLSGMAKMMRLAKRVLTTGVTIDPAFMIANFLRDTTSAWVVAGQKGFKPGLDSLKGFRKALKNDDSLIDIMAAGGGSGGFFRTSPEDVEKLIDSRISRLDQKRVLDSPRKLWEFYQRIGQASEAANRIAIFDAVVKNGGTNAEAVYQARDVMDFTMRGDYAAMRFLVETVPFLNARVQGLYRLYRGARDNPVGFLLRGSAIMAATMALMAVNWDREEYDELEDWDKDIYYHFWLDGQHYRLPKGFEVGAIFSTIPERMVRLMLEKDDGKKAGRRLLAMFRDTFALNPVPQLFKPMVEQWANKTSFTGRPIVGQGLERLTPEAQWSPYTSETARALGRAMPEFLGEARSPKRIEAIVRGYFGSLGTYVLSASDAMVRLAGDSPSKPAFRVDDVPVVKRFVRANPARNTVYVTDFYDIQRDVSRLVNTLRKQRKSGATDEVLALLAENRGEILTSKLVEKTRQTLSEINRAIRRIEESDKLSPIAKRKQIDLLTRRKNRVARTAVEQLARRGVTP